LMRVALINLLSSVAICCGYRPGTCWNWTKLPS